MKRNLFKTAAMLAASLSMAAPAAKANRAIQINQVQEQKAVPINETKGQGISINSMSGGLDFDYARMYKFSSPMYFPRYHPKMTWNQQRQKAKQRRRAR